MKKAAVFGMAAFYLLLTTGMFACIVHCSTQSLMPKPAMVMAGMLKAKHCTTKKECDCCKKHATFELKENLKPGIELQFAQKAAVVNQPAILHYLSYNPKADRTLLTEGKAPPGASGKLLSIQYRSLQI